MQPELLKRMMTLADATPVTVDALVAFLAAGRPAIFADWPEPTLAAYVEFHLRQRTLGWVRSGDGINGVGIIWQGDAGSIREAVRAQRPPFHWQPTDPAGDALMLEEFRCTRPGALTAVTRYFAGRFPGWPGLKLMTLRGPRLVEYPGRLGRRLGRI
jgi:hypothetical protein